MMSLRMSAVSSFVLDFQPEEGAVQGHEVRENIILASMLLLVVVVATVRSGRCLLSCISRS